MPKRKPKWENVPKKYRDSFGNGVGRESWPEELRNVATFVFETAYGREVWQKHDFEYSIGHTNRDRRHADREFHNALRKELGKKNAIWALLFWPFQLSFAVAVTLAGRKSFHYGPRYKTINEILADQGLIKVRGVRGPR